ncbi:MAG: hypothetical protein ACFFD2_05045 [Promethearchaeota archaeon]
MEKHYSIFYLNLVKTPIADISITSKTFLDKQFKPAPIMDVINITNRLTTPYCKGLDEKG